MTVAINSLSSSQGQDCVGKGMQSPAIMVEMARMLGVLQVEVAKALVNKAQMEETMSQAEIKAAQDNYENVINKIKESSQQEAHRSFWQKFVKVIEIAATVVAGAIALASGAGAFAMFAITTALVALAESPAMQPIKDGLCELFQDMGVSKEVATLLASVVVTVAIVAASVAAGKACSAANEMYSVAKKGVDAAEEMKEVTEMAGAAKQSAASSVPTGKIALLAGTQMVMSENLAQEIVAALPIKGAVAKEVAEIVATVIQDILCVIAMCKGANMNGGGAVPAFVAKLPSMSALIKGELVLQALGLVPQAMTAYTYGKQAHILSGLADATSSNDLIHGMMSMLSADQKTSARFEKSMWSGFQEENSRCGGDLFRGDAAFADVLAHRAV